MLEKEAVPQVADRGAAGAVGEKAAAMKEEKLEVDLEAEVQRVRVKAAGVEVVAVQVAAEMAEEKWEGAAKAEVEGVAKTAVEAVAAVEVAGTRAQSKASAKASASNGLAQVLVRGEEAGVKLWDSKGVLVMKWGREGERTADGIGAREMRGERQVGEVGAPEVAVGGLAGGWTAVWEGVRAGEQEVGPGGQREERERMTEKWAG